MAGKIDIEIALKNDKLAKFDISEALTVTIDTDYVDDTEDVYSSIEDYIWETYGVSLHYGEDFIIDDDNQEIINEIFNLD
jgi:hypothetical protein